MLGRADEVWLRELGVRLGDCFARMLLVACLVLVLVEQSLLVEQPKNPWLHAMIA